MDTIKVASCGFLVLGLIAEAPSSAPPASSKKPPAPRLFLQPESKKGAVLETAKVRNARRSIQDTLAIQLVLDPAISDAERQGFEDRIDDLRVLPAEYAAAILFQGYDFFLQFEAGAQGKSPLKTVWVFPQGGGGLQRLLASLKAEIRQDVASGEEVVKQLHESIARAPEDGKTILAEALKDPDENTRSQALQIAVDYGLEPSPEALQQMFLKDSSETLRLLAFDALIRRAECSGENLQTLLQNGLQDPSPLVQARAQERQATQSVPADDSLEGVLPTNVQ